MLAGDLRGHVELEALSAVPHLYGLVRSKGCAARSSIFESAPSIARIEQETVVTAASWKARACFLA